MNNDKLQLQARGIMEKKREGSKEEQPSSCFRPIRLMCVCTFHAVGNFSLAKT